MERVRTVVQARLERSKLELEETLRVLQDKTSELTVSNRELQNEIAHRERVEKALRDSEGFLEDVIESIQDGISVLNPDLTIRHTNQVMKTWYEDSLPLVGKKCYVCYRHQDHPCHSCPSLRCLNSGRTEREIVCGLPGSPVEWLEVYSFPIKDEQTGAVTGVVEFVRDITEHRKLEEQLARAERMDSIGRLAGGVAHDFNNLLMGIQGRASLMLMDTGSEHPFNEHLDAIQSYVSNASQLTSQLLGFGRGGKYEVRPTDLNQLIHDNLVMFGRTKKEIRIHRVFEDTLWTVEVDQGQFNQVFLNLFVNAWEAMPDGGELTVSTENVAHQKSVAELHGLPAGSFIRVRVRDTGIGIDKESQSRIFDPFYTTKGVGKGTGLGLASAYGIVKNHKGIITVDSQVGEGTAFTIYLPASFKQVKTDQGSSATVVNGFETVLLVDDEEMIVDVGSRLLNKLGYKVLTATSGPEALEIYADRQSEIGCVILDMVMPDQHGGETYDKLKQVNNNIKVLLSSGYSQDGQAAEILKRGCSGFIQKPFTIEALSGKIRTVLEKR
jgi:signal transduction histidine kinase